MLPQFSVKRLLVWIALLLIVLFVLFFLLVLPTNRAARFVAGINNGILDVNTELRSQKVHVPMIDLAAKTSAELLPCTWDDLVHRQRRIALSGMMPAKDRSGASPGDYKVSAEVGMSPGRMWLIDSDVNLFLKTP